MPIKDDADNVLAHEFSEKIQKEPSYLNSSFNAWNYVAREVNKKLGYECLTINKWREVWDEAVIVENQRISQEDFERFRKFINIFTRLT
jgi:hypothetical protein